MEMATEGRLEPDEDALFCPHCGMNLLSDELYEVDDANDLFYLDRKVSIFKMACGAYVQDGEFLSRRAMLDNFS